MRRFAHLLLILAAAASPAAGQSDGPDEAAEPDGGTPWYTGFAIGLPAYEGVAVWPAFTIGFQATRARPGMLGIDFAAGTMPWGLAYGVVPLGMRGGVTVPLGAPDRLLWPSAGVSVATVRNTRGGGSTTGFYAGLAGTFFSATRVPPGLRLGATVHQLSDASPIWLFEVGFVTR